MSPKEKQMIALGRLVREWGLHGDIHFRNYNPESSLDLKKLQVFILEAGRHQPVKILEIKKKAGKELLLLEGVQSPEAAKLMRDTELFIERSALPDTAENEDYLVDWIGAELQSEKGEVLGEVKEICDFGAGELLKVKYEKKDFFIPLNKEYFTEIDLKEKRIVVNFEMIREFMNES